MFQEKDQAFKYRITHYKKYKKGADQYMTWNALLSTTLLLNLPATIRIYRKTKNVKIFLLPIYSLLRNVAWSIGVVAGLFD